MQPRDSLLYHLRNGHSLADCLSHCFQNDVPCTLFLEKSSGIADIVSNNALSGDSDFVLVDGRFRLGLLNPLVSIHGISSIWEIIRRRRVQMLLLSENPKTLAEKKTRERERE